MKNTGKYWEYSEPNGWTETDIDVAVRPDETIEECDARLGVGDDPITIGDIHSSLFMQIKKIENGDRHWFHCELEILGTRHDFIIRTPSDLMAFLRRYAPVFSLVKDDAFISCFECRYWVPVSDRKSGSCRRHAPTLSEGAWAVWPVTQHIHGCGEGA